MQDQEVLETICGCQWSKLFVLNIPLSDSEESVDGGATIGRGVWFILAEKFEDDEGWVATDDPILPTACLRDVHERALRSRAQ